MSENANKYDLLEKLCNLNGLSGEEDEVRDFIKSEIESYCDEIITDNLGNLLAHKKGKKTPPKTIMFQAHMDETGYYVNGIDDDGCLKIDSIGVSPSVTPGKTVLVKATAGDEPKMIKGVIGVCPIHLASNSSELPQIKSLRVDIGAKKKEEAEGKVCLGDSVYFNGEFGKFGDFIKAKAIDDRAGCFAMIRLIKTELEYDTWFAFTVQEETGCRGSKAAAHRIRPDISFTLEGTTAADIGGVDDDGKVCILGNGVAVSFMDRSTVYNPRFIKAVTDIADEKGVKWQIKTFVSGGNDAGNIQRSADGTLVCTLSVPVRYLHSRISVCAPQDTDSMFDFCKAVSASMEKLFDIN
ncbi:MAG: M20/M25/M40 family metallo-hydrolase [Clostridia bacterium]|nr:M20/M25/M40 family metallo-hydrolase [Clostridia bacterium]